MISENLKSLLLEIPENVTLIAVTKTHPVETILEVYKYGIRNFGESRVQELISKQPLLPPDIRWNMIGHLQKNKVKYIAPFIHLIHSIDSESLLEVVQKEAVKNNRIISVLLQVYIAKEEEKFGFSPEEVYQFFKNYRHKKYNHINFKGLMGMATYTEDVNIIKSEFNLISDLFQNIKTDFSNSCPDFKELSIGMSSDYKYAIEYGSTMVRIGSLIFGERYSTK